MLLQDKLPTHQTDRQCRLSVCLVVLALLLEPPDELGLLRPSTPMPELRPAASCTVSLPPFGHTAGDYLAPLGTMTMDNDGGWCWLQFIQTFHQLTFVPPIRVLTSASHGRVLAERLPNVAAVAYLPAAGFVGTDHFVVRTDGPIPHNIPFEVTVR